VNVAHLSCELRCVRLRKRNANEALMQSYVAQCSEYKQLTHYYLFYSIVTLPAKSFSNQRLLGYISIALPYILAYET